LGAARKFYRGLGQVNRVIVYAFQIRRELKNRYQFPQVASNGLLGGDKNHCHIFDPKLHFVNYSAGPFYLVRQFRVTGLEYGNRLPDIFFHHGGHQRKFPPEFVQFFL
jgi:hypothetical protein